MLQKRLAKVGLAKQSAKGAPAAEAAFDIGVLSGAVAGAEITEDDLDPTASSRVLEAVDRTLVVPGMAFDAVAMPKVIGLLLSAVTGTRVTTGAGPYEHVFTEADDLPYLTVFSRYADSYLRMADVKVDELELEFSGVGALRAKAQMMGLDLSFLADSYDVAVDGDERVAGGNKLSAAGGNLQLDGAAARVTGGSVTVGNKVTAVKVASKVTPDEVFPGRQEVSFSLTIVPDDLALWRKQITGSAVGATISKAPFEAAVSLHWSKDANTDLVFAAPRCQLLADFPDADPEGGPAEITVAGKVLRAVSGPAYSFTLRNDVAAY